jgi:hypothetical protein
MRIEWTEELYRSFGARKCVKRAERLSSSGGMTIDLMAERVGRSSGKTTIDGLVG